MEDNAKALQALRLLDLSPVTFITSVWDDNLKDVAELNRDVSESITMDLEDLLAKPTSHPQGRVYLGPAGSGKTHLLGRLRKTVQSLGGQFILVDLTGVDDFLRITALHYLQSLLKDAGQTGFPGKSQLDLVLGTIYAHVMGKESLDEALQRLSRWSRDWRLGETCGFLDDFLQEFAPAGSDVPDLHQVRRVLRALLAFGSDDEEMKALAHSWLQGVELESAEARRIGLPPRMGLIEIIESESYLMSLRGPTLVAFDQLDSIVTHKELASRNDAEKAVSEAALAVVAGIAGGLSDVWNRARRTLVAVACLEESWRALQKTVGSNWQRFAEPLTLDSIRSSAVAMEIIERHLRPAYLHAEFQPPYATYPFKPAFFAHTGLRPRQFVVRCLEHVRRCRENKLVTELDVFDERTTPRSSVSRAPNHRLDNAFLRARAEADLAAVLAPESEDGLGRMVAELCGLIVRELPPPSSIDVTVELDAPRKAKFPAIHARLRLTFREESDREEHLCLRALQAAHPTAFLARARAAITESGIDALIPYRKLAFLRTVDVPSGKKCSEVIADFQQRGGRFVSVEESDVRMVLALTKLASTKDPDFDSWIRQRRPLHDLALARDLFADYARACGVGEEWGSLPLAMHASASATSTSAVGLEAGQETTTEPAGLIVGRQTGALAPTSLVILPAAALSRHVVIRAGSGSGKTVLLKRLVEEAALNGIPSIVVDGANDLVFLGDRAPDAHPAWLPGDRERAERYHAETCVRVWTPGLISGRPLRFAALPDFSALADDAEGLEESVALAVGSLSEVAGLESGSTAKLKAAVLTKTLLYFARNGGRTLQQLAETLDQLPPGAGADIKDAAKLAGQVADAIRASVVTDRLLSGDSRGQDPGDLLTAESRRTMVSVISLEGLSEPERSRLVDQLAAALFAWIRKFPPSGTGRMNGLLVLDEAQEFLPSVRTTACKQSLLRLSVQARKYGLGLVLATQNPKNLDYNAVSQFSTHFYGKAAAPQAIEVIRKAIEERGGNAPDIANLDKGTFYFTSSEGRPTPIRIQSPMCLSHHPDQQTATVEQIVARALRA